MTRGERGSPTRQGSGLSSANARTRVKKADNRVACVNLPHVAAAIEIRDNPQLVDRPMVIEGPHPGPRVVYDLSALAHGQGVRRGMTLTQARKVCPEVTVVAPRLEAYQDTFQAMVNVLNGFTSLVEPMDLERSWLSANGLVARGGVERYLAEELARKVRQEVELGTRIGMAHGKETSRIITQYLDRQDIMVLPPGREVAFLGGLGIAYLPLELAALQRIAQLGLSKIAQYAALPAKGILPRFGYPGLRAYLLSHGEDDPHVRPRMAEPFFESEHVFLEPIIDLEMMRRLIAKLAGDVAEPLAREFQMAATLRFAIHLEDGRVVEQRRVMDEPTVNARALANHAEALMGGLELTTPIERVQLAVQGLCPTKGRQLDLFRQDYLHRLGVDQTLRRLQTKYGPDVVQQGHRLEPGSPLPERRTYLAPWESEEAHAAVQPV